MRRLTCRPAGRVLVQGTRLLSVVQRASHGDPRSTPRRRRARRPAGPAVGAHSAAPAALCARLRPATLPARARGVHPCGAVVRATSGAAARCHRRPRWRRHRDPALRVGGELERPLPLARRSGRLRRRRRALRTAACAIGPGCVACAGDGAPPRRAPRAAPRPRPRRRRDRRRRSPRRARRGVAVARGPRRGVSGGTLRHRCRRRQPSGAPRSRAGDYVGRGAGAPCHAHVAGFDLHAGVAVPAGYRERLEHLCRYVLRPPIAQDALTIGPDGRVRLSLRRLWRDGTRARCSTHSTSSVASRP